MWILHNPIIYNFNFATIMVKWLNSPFLAASTFGTNCNWSRISAGSSLSLNFKFITFDTFFINPLMHITILIHHYHIRYSSSFFNCLVTYPIIHNSEFWHQRIIGSSKAETWFGKKNQWWGVSSQCREHRPCHIYCCTQRWCIK